MTTCLQFISLTRTHQRLALLALLCLAMLPMAVLAATEATPPVSRREARVLEDVHALSLTNAAAAIAVMKDRAPRDTGSAWHFTLGNLYVQVDDLAQAEQAYLKALEITPDFLAARINLGRVFLMREQPEDAIRVYLALTREGLADAETMLLLGHALLMREHWLSAENAYRQTLLLEPGHPEALRGLVQCLMRQERLREAQALLNEWLDAEPERKELWTFVANLRLALDKPDAALVALESALRLGLTDADMLATMGDLYMNRSQYEKAMARYESSFSGPDLAVDRLLRAAQAALGADRPDDAERLLALLDKQHDKVDLGIAESHHRAIKRLRARLALLRDDGQRAAEIAEALLQRSPTDADALMLLGEARHRIGEIEAAAMAYERAARLPGWEAQARIRHAQVEIERENYQHAAELLEAAQQVDPQPHVARYLEQVRRLADR